MLGVVLGGCSLIINDDLEKGSQIPYIQRAMKEGYEVLVLNANLNRWPDGSEHRTEATFIPVCISTCSSLHVSACVSMSVPISVSTHVSICSYCFCTDYT